MALTRALALEGAAVLRERERAPPWCDRHADAPARGRGIVRLGGGDAPLRRDPPARAALRPEEVAEAALFLASDAAWVTGTALAVDRGIVAVASSGPPLMYTE